VRAAERLREAGELASEPGTAPATVIERKRIKRH
jgi:hypothetical protein